jgi:hypothetical protein
VIFPVPEEAEPNKVREKEKIKLVLLMGNNKFPTGH